MTEPESDPDRPSRNWRIPSRIYGRVRTSTVLLGICFVLTALLYDQVRPPAEVVQTGPQPIDTSQYTQQQTYQPEYTAPSTTAAPTSTGNTSTTDDPTSEGESSGEPGSSTGGSGSSTTQDPTYLPGLTVPPELRSLFPPAPQAPSATGNP